MRMKGKDMAVRLKNLQNEDSAFAQLIKQNGGKPAPSAAVKLNTEEQAKVEQALNSVETLKTQFKRKLASSRIVDLTKIKGSNDDRPLNATEVQKAVAEHEKRNSEQFNFLVVEARNKMNDALEFLFQKDSKLRNLQSQTTDTAMSSHQDQTSDLKKDESNYGEVKIGSLKVRGKIPIPNRKVVLDEAALSELRRNVQLLTI
jgi:hypothetical protein